VTTKDGPRTEAVVRGARREPEGREQGDRTFGFARCECTEATAWRMLAASPHILDLLAEWAEWHERRVVSQTHLDLSAAGRWTLGLTYEELRHRRRLTSVHDCGECGTAVELKHPLERWQFDRLPDLSWVRCPACSTSTVGQRPTADAGTRQSPAATRMTRVVGGEPA
jgi:hypothetical protein